MMANADIHVVGPGEIGLICKLYNDIFRPAVDEAFFHERLDGRKGVLFLVADVEKRPVGFLCGYELRPSTYYAWICGVLPDARRMGVAAQLMSAEDAWVRERDYEMMRLEVNHNSLSALHLALKMGYVVVGTRLDIRNANTLVIFEKTLDEHH